MVKLSKTKLVLRFVLVTAAVLMLFVVARVAFSVQELREDLGEKAAIVATRVAGSAKPTLWGIFEKSVDRHHSGDVASALLDSELLDQAVTAVIVRGNFGHLFMGKVRFADGRVEIYDQNNDAHEQRLREAGLSESAPIKQGAMTIGNVRVFVTAPPLWESEARTLLFEFVEIVVVTTVLLVGLVYVLEHTVIAPARSMAVARQAFESIGSALFVTDGTGRIVDANSAYHLYAGMTPGREGGKAALPFDDDAFEDTLNEVLLRKSLPESWEGEMTLRTEAGIRIPVQVRVSAVLDESRRDTGFKVTLIRDMTQQKEEERNLQHLVEESSRLGRLAEQANQAKSEFLATMSHELRTPLNAIIGFSELLLLSRDTLPSDKVEDYNSSVLTSGRHLLSLINDILDLSKVDAGKMEVQLNEVDVLSLATECARFLEPVCRQRNIRIDVNVEDRTILTDQRLLKQVFLNLLSNAVKFSPPGASVDLIGAAQGIDGYGIEIRDRGCGMTDEQVGRALEPFVQLQGSYNRSAEGTGLGLPLVLRFARLLNIDLRIDSEPGVGTSVKLNTSIGVGAANAETAQETAQETAAA